eukprot:scaffold89754_cov46-Prasinocladus_malaysianus.AAC.1
MPSVTRRAIACRKPSRTILKTSKMYTGELRYFLEEALVLSFDNCRLWLLTLIILYRANARASTSLEIMQVVLAGSLAFDLLDRVHGLYLGDATELEWSVKFFAPVYNYPGALLAVNLACWLILGLLIKFLLNHFAAQAAGWMAIRYTINLAYSPEAMEAYLASKSPEVEGGESDKATIHQKYSWTERYTSANREQWKGEPPK